MTENLARRTARISPVAVLILALGRGADSLSAPTQNITPAPAPAPPSMRYHGSGIVIDDTGLPIAVAAVGRLQPADGVPTGLPHESKALRSFT